MKGNNAYIEKIWGKKLTARYIKHIHIQLQLVITYPLTLHFSSVFLHISQGTP